MLEEHIFPATRMMLEESADKPLGWRRVAVVGMLLHDTVEDAAREEEITLDFILVEFGDDIQLFVALMTDVGKDTETYFALIFENEMAARGKLCDRRNNLRWAWKVPDRREIGRFCDETDRYIVPLAERHDPQVLTEIRDQVAHLRVMAG